MNYVPCILNFLREVFYRVKKIFFFVPGRFIKNLLFSGFLWGVLVYVCFASFNVKDGFALLCFAMTVVLFFAVECRHDSAEVLKAVYTHYYIYARARNVSSRVACGQSLLKGGFLERGCIGFIAFGFFKLKTPFAIMY